MFREIRSVVIDNYAFVPKFRTESSCQLVVVRNSAELGTRIEKGWVDLHHIHTPIDSITIRGSLPSECLRFDFLKRLLSAIYCELQISEASPTDVIFFRATECVDMSRLGKIADCEHMTDRISTTRSFRLPKE